MCLLSYFPPGVQPNADALRCGARCNNDGHGFGILIPGRDEIMVFKSMNPTEAVDAFVKARAEHPDGPALFHSRLTTHGDTNTDNCHPFVVNGDPRTVVAHNGILPQDAHPRAIGKTVVEKVAKDGTAYQAVTPVYDERSDTRILAEDLLMKRWRTLDSRHTRKRLTSWLGRGNKILVLTTDPKYKRNSYLFNSELGEWVGGVWYSNGSFRGYGRGTSSYSTGYLPEWLTPGTSASRSEGMDRWDTEWDDADDPWYGYRDEAEYGYVKNSRGYWVPASADRYRNDDASTWPVTLGGSRTGPQKSGTEATKFVTFVTCDLCQAASVDADYGLCLDCYACQDCMSYVSHCECYGTPRLTTYAYGELTKALDRNAPATTVRSFLRAYRRVCATFQGVADKRRDAALREAEAEQARIASGAPKAITVAPATEEVIEQTIDALRAMGDAVVSFSDGLTVGVSADGAVQVHVSTN